MSNVFASRFARGFTFSGHPLPDTWHVVTHPWQWPSTSFAPLSSRRRKSVLRISLSPLMEGSSKTEVVKVLPEVLIPDNSPTTNVRTPHHPFLIGVAGGTASGKTSVCRKIMEQLGEHNRGQLVSLSQDSFYRDLSPDELEHVETYNFDHPDAFDFAELLQILQQLKKGEVVEIPNYDYVTNARLPYRTTIAGATVVLLEGILVFHLPEIRDLFDLKIFVDTDADTRLARRIRRDIVERGRNVMQVLSRYEQSVKPSFETHISPTKQFADIIVPRGAENSVAIGLIKQHVQMILEQRGSK